MGLELTVAITFGGLGGKRTGVGRRSGSPGWPQAHLVPEDGLSTYPPASAFQVLGLQVCSTVSSGI